MSQLKFVSSLPDIVSNAGGLYEGDLQHYLRVVFEASNIRLGYHGLRHMLHVTTVCYQACVYYQKRRVLTPRRMRNLLIAALVHDLGHRGTGDDDFLNISIATALLRLHILPYDEPFFADIASIIAATQHGYSDLGATPSLEQLIIRDADITQSLSNSWVSDILVGLGGELGISPLEMLEKQDAFLAGIQFQTDFARECIGESLVAAKRQEVAKLLAILP